MIAVDSNALTYLIESMSPSYEPSSDRSGLAADRVAMIRIRLYRGISLARLPTVELEYRAIRRGTKHTEHLQAADLFLSKASWPVAAPSLEARVRELNVHHRGLHDCRIVAEAELAGVDVLLTCDDQLVCTLTPRTWVRLQRPAAFFESLGVLPGAEPLWVPALGNPLAAKEWWRF